MDDTIEEFMAEVGRELSPFTSVACRQCRRSDTLQNHGMFLVRATTVERYDYEVYCSDCWDTVKSAFQWVGVLAAFVYDPVLVHCLFGRPFGRIKPVEGGKMLFANEIKQQQIELF